MRENKSNNHRKGSSPIFRGIGRDRLPANNKQRKSSTAHSVYSYGGSTRRNQHNHVGAHVAYRIAITSASLIAFTSGLFYFLTLISK